MTRLSTLAADILRQFGFDDPAPNVPAEEEEEIRRLQESAYSLIQGLRGPLFPLPGALRFEPRTLTDIAPAFRQVEPHFLLPLFQQEEISRPLELLPARERRRLEEEWRIWNNLGEYPVRPKGT